MSRGGNYDREVSRLVAGLLDSDLSDTDFERLTHLLQERDDCLERYLAYVDIHTLLWLRNDELVFSTGLSTVAESSIADTEKYPTASPSLHQRWANKQRVTDRWRRQLKQFGARWSGRQLSIAAILLILVIAVVILYPSLLRKDDKPVVVGNQNPQHVAPRLTNTRDCKWGRKFRFEADGSFAFGQMLYLDQGVAEIAFGERAVVTIEGPAHFTAMREDQLTLEYGNLVAKVGVAGIGFRVVTPRVTVVDLGTEFGTAVNPSGEVEVHVFQGSVETLPSGDRNLTATKLYSGEIACFDGTGKAIRLTGSKTKFVREVSSRSALDKDAAPLQVSSTPTTQISKNGLRIWLKADEISPLDVGEQPAANATVTRWCDASGNRNDAEHSTPEGNQGRQIVCTLMDGANGTRFVRFLPETTDLLTSPHVHDGEPLNDLTLIAVYRVLTSMPDPEGMLRPLGLGLVSAANRWNCEHLNFATDPSLRFDGAYIGPDQYRLKHPTDFVVRATVRRGQRFSDYFDGQVALDSVEEADVRGIVDDFHLGHLFIAKGMVDVAEVLLYDRALEESEREFIEKHLIKKYQLLPPPIP